MLLMRIPIGLVGAWLLCTLVSAQTTIPVQPYRWKPAPMIGTGFVDGIVFHPTAPGVCYARTDIGGAYRWNPDGKRWMPILDWVDYKDRNLMGVESIALDPQDPRRVYLACGTYTNDQSPNAAILRSDDYGHTFSRANVPFKMGGNENGRGDGERLSVDPNDGRILFFGSRLAGLWRSDDRAATWRRVESFPPPEPMVATRWFGPSGIVVTAFDPRSGSPGYPSKDIFAAVSQTGPSIFHSRDGGLTWTAVPGQPTGLVPIHMVWDGRDSFVISYGTTAGPSMMRSGAVYKLNVDHDGWTDITPERGTFGYVGLSVQAGRPDTIIVATFTRPKGDQIFRTTDGGNTWKPIIGGPETFDRGGALYTNHVGIHWLFGLEIDPSNPDHAIFTTGYGGHETYNLTDADQGKPVLWRIMSKGIEEAAVLDLYSPVQGAPLISAIGDYGGFVHWDINTPYDSFQNPSFSNTGGVAGGDLAPNIVVRVGTGGGPRGAPRTNIAYSLDGGRSWQPPAQLPNGLAYGKIAVGSDGKNWVWSAGRGGYAQTSDRGATWTPCKGLPGGLIVVADRVDPNRFYAADVFGGMFFISDDGGVSYREQALDVEGGRLDRRADQLDPRGGHNRVFATPGRAGDVWVAAFNGLYHSENAGFQWQHLPSVSQILAFGFGAPAPGASTPAIYLAGTVDGIYGIFRSDDDAQSWVRINDAKHQYAIILQITGDPKRYGRVYVGIHGRGVVYGDPSD
jgi:hypothetical protein